MLIDLATQSLSFYFRTLRTFAQVHILVACPVITLHHPHEISFSHRHH